MAGKYSSLFRNLSAGKEQVQLNSGLQLLRWWSHWCNSCCWHWWSLRWYEPDKTIKRQKQKHETNICTRRIRRMWLWSSPHKEARTACVPGHQSRIHITHQGNVLVLYAKKYTTAGFGGCDHWGCLSHKLVARGASSLKVCLSNLPSSQWYFSNWNGADSNPFLCDRKNTFATGPVFDAWWLGPYRESRPIQQTSALDLLLAVVEQGVRQLWCLDLLRDIRKYPFYPGDL